MRYFFTAIQKIEGSWCSPKCICAFWRCWISHACHQLSQYVRHTFWICSLHRFIFLLLLLFSLLFLLFPFSSALSALQERQFTFSTRRWAVSMCIVGETSIWIYKGSINYHFSRVPQLCQSINLFLAYHELPWSSHGCWWCPPGLPLRSSTTPQLLLCLLMSPPSSNLIFALNDN